MATFDSRAGSSAAGIVPVAQPTQQQVASSPIAPALQLAQVGLSLFSANAQHVQMQEKREAEALKMQQFQVASDAAAGFIQEVEQVRATKGGLAAQTFASQKFAEIQGSLGVGERETFVDSVKKGLGFNPIEKITSDQADAERAKALADAADKEQATAIYMASVNINDPKSAATAFEQVQNMTPEQVEPVPRACSFG